MENYVEWLKQNLVQLVIIFAGVFMAWGILSQRVAAIEKEISSRSTILERVAVLESRNTEVIKRLDRIELKIDKLVERP